MFSTSTGPKALCEARCLLSKNGDTARRPSREFLNEVGRPDLAHTRPGLPGWPQQEGEWGVGAGGGDADGRGCCFRLAGGSQEALKPEPRESLPD